MTCCEGCLLVEPHWIPKHDLDATVYKYRKDVFLERVAERVLGLLKNPLFGHFPGIASPALGLGCLPRGKSFGARADLFWHGGSGLLALLVRPGRPVFNTLLRHN